MRKQNKPAYTSDETKLLVATASHNAQEAAAAMAELAISIQLPLRQGILNGDITGGIFEPIQIDINASSEFPLDFLAPGTEREFVAYTIPNHGLIPYRNVEGDFVQVPIYDVGNSIDWNLKYARDARWDVVEKAKRVFQAGFVKKMNDDCWQTILTAGYDRNIIVYDSDAAAGQFTKRLVSLMKTVMRRNGGGNSTSNNRGQLTDLFVSPEAMEDMRNWNVDQVDEVTRREIFTSTNDNVMNRIFGVNLRDLDELGEGQEYNDYFDVDLGATLPSGDLEIVVGLDLSTNDSFVMPIKEEVSVYDDPALHRQRRAGVYGWMSAGVAVLDGRRVLIGSL
jgi:hypothetical protein